MGAVLVIGSARADDESASPVDLGTVSADVTGAAALPEQPQPSMLDSPPGAGQTPPNAGQTTPPDSADPAKAAAPQASPIAEPMPIPEEEVKPWDYDPYRVLIWVVSDRSEVNAAAMERPLRKLLEREYFSIWDITIRDAPSSVAASAERAMNELSYDLIAASDPVIAVKKDHDNAIRIRNAASVRENVGEILGTKDYIESLKVRGGELGDESLDGVAPKTKAIEGDMLTVVGKWSEEKTEALLVSRGFAKTLEKPLAKVVELPVSGLVATSVDRYDRIFIVRVSHDTTGGEVSVVEFVTLMRYFGSPVSVPFYGAAGTIAATGRALITAFSPEVRIDEAGLKGARGMIRASGLILDPKSDSLIKPGELLLPMVRKNDRSGNPILIGPLDWAYLVVVDPKPTANNDRFDVSGGPATIDVLKNDIDPDGDKLTVNGINGRDVEPGMVVTAPKGVAKLNEDGTITYTPDEDYEGPVTFKYRITDGTSETVASLSDDPNVPAPEPLPIPKDGKRKIDHTRVWMDFFSGRAGGLQGRANKRTFKRAIRIRPREDQTVVRLHAKGDPDFPLIGYELYQKELYSKKMTFVGRTDWNGRLVVPRTEDSLRLLYVKNGGAVLARLPVVPGLTDREVADLIGDDMRLEAEAYVNGISNSIIDLVAIRKLLGARIRGLLRKGEIDRARELLDALRNQPTKDVLSGDMDKQQAIFLELIGTRNQNARKKVDNMFTTTREMLDEQITHSFIRDLEADFATAKKLGRLPPKKKDEDEYDASANVAPGADEKKKKK